MQAVDIVSPDDVLYDGADVLMVHRLSGVENQQSIVFEEAFRALQVGVSGGELRRALGLCAERIDPSVDFHVALMALLYHPSQRVPSGIPALRSGEESAPRFVAALVESVGLGPHLKHDGVDARSLTNVEMLRESLLHLLRREPLKLPIDTLNPRSSKFAFRR